VPRGRKFADSLMEETGFEPSVPGRERNESLSGTGTVTEATKVRLEAIAYIPGTDGSNPFPSREESANFRFLSGRDRAASRIGLTRTRGANLGFLPTPRLCACVADAFRKISGGRARKPMWWRNGRRRQALAASPVYATDPAIDGLAHGRPG
jgi:hypothetical protein